MVSGFLFLSLSLPASYCKMPHRYWPCFHICSFMFRAIESLHQSRWLKFDFPWCRQPDAMFYFLLGVGGGTTEDDDGWHDHVNSPLRAKIVKHLVHHRFTFFNSPPDSLQHGPCTPPFSNSKNVIYIFDPLGGFACLRGWWCCRLHSAQMASIILFDLFCVFTQIHNLLNAISGDQNFTVKLRWTLGLSDDRGRRFNDMLMNGIFWGMAPQASARFIFYLPANIVWSLNK